MMRWRIVAVLAMLAGIALLTRASTTVGAGTRFIQPSALTTAAESVQVRHEFVVVPLPERVDTRRAAAEPSSARPRPSTARRNPTVRPRPSESLLDRTRRAFLGDGRYRPEPFPRAGGH